MPAPGPIELSVRALDERPDIVLFLTDEQRHDEVGYESGGYHETPNLDALAARGTIFELAYSSSTVCVPARASLLTGLAHHRVPLESNTLALRQGFWTIARALRAIGYQTALVGKMHFFPMYAEHGFDTMRLSEHLVPYSGYPEGEVDDYHRFLIWQGRADAAATHMFGADERAAREYDRNFGAVPFPHDRSLHPVSWIASEARRIIQARRPRAPLFLVVSFPRPHSPYDPPEPYASMYDPRDVRLPTATYAANDRLPADIRSAFDRNDRERHRPQRALDLPDHVVRRVLSYVRGMVHFVDDAMGEVIRALDPDRTVMFFTSDHGTYSGHRGLLGKVPWMGFEDLARVPFVCAAPGGVPGQTVRTPVQSHDFVPTVLDYAGIEIPEMVFDSTSLKGILEGAAPPPGRAVFTGISMGWPMVRRHNMKLIRRGRLYGPEVLFDLDRDPGETKSVLDEPQYQDALTDLRIELSLMVQAPIPPLPSV